MKNDNMFSNVDWGLNEDNQLEIHVNDYKEIGNAYELLDYLRNQIAKEDEGYFRFYIRDQCCTNANLMEFEKGDEYYVDKEFLERQYTDSIRSAMHWANTKYTFSTLQNDIPDIDETWFEKYKPDLAVLKSKTYGEYDYYLDDYLVDWNGTKYDEAKASGFIELANGSVTHIDENTIKWEVDNDMFEMNVIVSDESTTDRNTLEYSKYKKIGKNKYECQNKTYEFVFKKNGNLLDIEVFGSDYIHFDGYPYVRILMKDVEKLINRKIVVDKITGDISVLK